MYHIAIENKYGDCLELTNSNAYRVKATGLSPVVSNIITKTVANYGGEKYINSRQGRRNIVLTIFVCNPAETNRINLYKYIKSDDYIKVYFKNSTRDVYIEGYVESFECDLFEQTQTAQVSIICPQPQFIDMSTQSIDNAGVTNEFSCPFSSVCNIESAEGNSLVFNDLPRSRMLFNDFSAGVQSTQTVLSGKNLLQNNLATQTINGLTITVNLDKTVTINGTATSDTPIYINSSTGLSANTQYTLSGCPSGGSASSYRLRLGKSDNTYIGQDVGSGYTFTTTSAVSIALRIDIIRNTVCNNLAFKPMIEQGSTVTAYESYCGGIPAPNPNYPQSITGAGASVDMSVQSGKNLLPNEATSQTQYGLTFTVNSDKSVTINGTATADMIYPFYSYQAIYPHEFIKGDSYIVSVSSELPQNCHLNTFQYIGYWQLYTDTNPATFTVNNNITGFIMRLDIVNGTPFNNVTVHPMIRVATDPDDTYEPYNGITTAITTDIALQGINSNYRDKIISESGMWYIAKNTQALTIDGTRNWEVFSSSDNIYSTNISSVLDNVSGILPALCDRFIVKDNILLDNGEMAVINEPNRYLTTIYVRVSTSIATTANALKTWFSSHSTEIILPTRASKTAIDEDIESVVAEGTLNVSVADNHFTHMYGSITVEPIVFGDFNENQSVFVNNLSDDEIGFIYQIHCTDEVRNIMLYHEESNSFLKLNGIFRLDDIITIDTRQAKKSVTKNYRGVTTNIINSLDNTSVWLKLNSGFNHLVQTADLGAHCMESTLTYTNEYEGV